LGRPTLSTHRKFNRLARVLGSDVAARGHLEILWESAYQSGDDYLGSSQDVESAAHWAGESGLLTKALLEAGGVGNAGFIEEDPERPGHFRVHDLFENAPDYVQKRRERELNRKARGVTLSDLRREAGKRGRAAQFPQQPSGQLPAGGGQLQPNVRQLPANGETPAPARAPAQKEKTLAEPPAPKCLAISLPLDDGSEFDVTAIAASELQTLFPGVEVAQELRSMRSWCLANEEKRKTRRGIRRFIDNWLREEHKKAPVQASVASATPLTQTEHGAESDVPPNLDEEAGEDLWQDLRATLSQSPQLNSESFKMFLSTKAVGLSADGILFVTVPTSQLLGTLELPKYREPLEEAIAGALKVKYIEGRSRGGRPCPSHRADQLLALEGGRIKTTPVGGCSSRG
jgi:hypothetical protein